MRLWANAVVIVLSLFATFSNGLVAIIIWKSTSLRTKCFVLIAANGLVDSLLSISYASSGMKRIYRYVAGFGEVMTRWECFCETPQNAFFQLMSQVMAAVLVIDRSVAVFCPMKYKVLTYRKLTVPLIICAIVYSLLQLLARMYDSYMSPKEIILFSCGIDDSTGLVQRK